MEMTDCPNTECHENLTAVRNVVFDEKHGLRTKVSKIAVWIAITVIGIPLFITGIKVWFGTETAAMRFADLTAMSALRERVSAQEIQYKFLCDSLSEMKITLNELRRDVKALDKP